MSNFQCTACGEEIPIGRGEYCPDCGTGPYCPDDWDHHACPAEDELKSGLRRRE